MLKQSMSPITQLFIEYAHTFTDEGKARCVTTVEKLIDLSFRIDHEGLLTAEGNVSSLENICFRTGLQLMIDGIEPESVQDILYYLIVSNRFQNGALLESIIVAEGLNAIHTRMDPFLLPLFLASMLGEKFLSNFDKYLSRESLQTTYESLLREFVPRLRFRIPKSAVAKLLSLDAPSLFALVSLRLTVIEDIVYLLAACRPDVVKTTLDKLPLRLRIRILSTIGKIPANLDMVTMADRRKYFLNAVRIITEGID